MAISEPIGTPLMVPNVPGTTYLRLIPRAMCEPPLYYCTHHNKYVHPVEIQVDDTEAVLACEECLWAEHEPKEAMLSCEMPGCSDTSAEGCVCKMCNGLFCQRHMARADLCDTCEIQYGAYWD